MGLNMKIPENSESRAHLGIRIDIVLILRIEFANVFRIAIYLGILQVCVAISGHFHFRWVELRWEF
jgi:hypothetical protein